MPSALDFANIFKTFREVDLRPIRDEAEQQTWIAIVSADLSKARDLATCFYLSPRELPPTDASREKPGPIVTLLERADLAARGDVIVLVLANAGAEMEPQAVGRWLSMGKPVIVVADQTPPEFKGANGQPDEGKPSHALTTTTRQFAGEWGAARYISGSIKDWDFAQKQLAPAVLAALPERHLSLGRNFPLLRIPVAHQIINDTSVANAGYAFSTGIAEIIPVLDIPLNVADMIVLTKAQAFMVYKLGLILGLSTRWQDHLTAFGGTIGAGFVWRTLARQLVGLIPAIGILPKVAIAYAGTFAIGQGVLQWYTTGREVQKEDLERFFREALGRGKAVARGLAERAPKRRLPRLLNRSKVKKLEG